MSRSIVLALMLLAVAACSPVQIDPDASGGEIYSQVCSRCHGGSLEGGVGPPLGSGSEAAAQPDSFLIQTIERGKGRMPSFGRSLSDDQIERVARYIRTEQGQ